jgi:hypothetical protein
MMVFKPFLVLAAGVGLVLPPGASAAQDGFGTPGRRPAGAQACPTIRNLADENWRGEIGFDAGPIERLDAWERQIRGETATVAVPADATVILRAFGGWSETQQVATDSVATVWRGADGVWRFHKVDWAKGAIPPPPPPPGDPTPPIPFEPRTVSSGVLAAGSAQALDDLLAEPCLMLEPASTGPALAVRPGVPIPPPCYGGTGGVVQLTRGGRTRTWSLFCPRLLSGELMRLALYPREGSPGGAAPAPDTAFSSLETARARAAQVLSYNEASTAWSDETADATELRFRHRATGLLCRVPNDPEIGLGAGSYGDVCRWGAGPDGQRLVVSKNDDRRDLVFRMQEEAPDSVRSSWDSGALRPSPRTTRLAGHAVLDLSFADGPAADARDERYVRVHGAQVGDWQVVLATHGAKDDREAVDASQAKTWSQLMTVPEARP